MLEFAHGVIETQANGMVDCSLVREYTAQLIARLRARPAPLNPTLLPESWKQHRIAQAAIQACEDVLAEQNKTHTDGPSPKTIRSRDCGVIQPWNGKRIRQKGKLNRPESKCFPSR